MKKRTAKGVGKTMTPLSIEQDYDMDLTLEPFYAMLDYNRWTEEE